MSRATDEHVEQEVAKFLDRFFYPRLTKHFQRCYDKPSQFAGVDLLLRFHGQYLKIDEKAKYRGLVNRVLEYPSFELQFINRAGNEQCGWFLSTSSWTTHYAFIAVFLKQGFTSEEDISCENISHLNVLFVNRKELQEYICNIDPSLNLKDEVQKLRNNTEQIKKTFFHKRFWLKKSVNFEEQPINLVLKRETLLKLEKTREFEVSREKLRILH